MTTQANSVCPDPDPDLNTGNRGVGLAIFVIGVVYFAAGIAWWISRKSHPLLRKRNFGLIVLTAVGYIICLIWGELFLYYGSDDVPCDAFLWFSMLLVPWGMGPVVARLYAFKNHASFANLLQEELVGEDLGGQENMFLRPSLGALICAFLSPYRFFNNTKEPQVGIDLSSDKEGNVFERQDSKLDRVVHVSDISTLQQIRAAYFAQSDAMGVIVVCILSIPGIFIATTWSGAREGPYGMHCYGCDVRDEILYPVLLQAIIVAAIGLIALFMLRNAPDPLSLLRELRFSWFCVCVFGASLALSYMDPGNLRSSGKFDWVHVGSIALLISFTVQCPLQVLRTFSVRKGSVSLADIDQDPDLKKDFEIFVEGAFFPETVAFLEATAKYKSAHERAAGREALQRAKLIYQVFLSRESLISLHFDKEKVAKVEKALNGARGTRDNLFDELLDDLENNIFSRALLPLFKPKTRNMPSGERIVSPHEDSRGDRIWGPSQQS